MQKNINIEQRSMSIALVLNNIVRSHMVNAKNSERINIHVFVNKGHKVLYEKYFLSTLKDNWNVVRHAVKVQDDQNFGTDEFYAIISEKVKTLITKILPAEEKAGQPYFILSDVDIQFFQSCSKLIADNMHGKDMLFQRENYRNSEVNTGFVIIRPNKETKEFWTKVLKIMKKKHTNEQTAVNMIISKEKVKWGVLPNTIWANSNPAYDPRKKNFSEIYLHHANFTPQGKNKKSLLVKIEQLHIFKKHYQQHTARSVLGKCYFRMSIAATHAIRLLKSACHLYK